MLIVPPPQSTENEIYKMFPFYYLSAILFFAGRLLTDRKKMFYLFSFLEFIVMLTMLHILVASLNTF